MLDRPAQEAAFDTGFPKQLHSFKALTKLNKKIIQRTTAYILRRKQLHKSAKLPSASYDIRFLLEHLLALVFLFPFFPSFKSYLFTINEYI